MPLSTKPGTYDAIGKDWNSLCGPNRVRVFSCRPPWATPCGFASLNSDMVRGVAHHTHPSP
jgi:hypothetical protein